MQGDDGIIYLRYWSPVFPLETKHRTSTLSLPLNFWAEFHPACNEFLILMSLPHDMMVARFPLAGGNSIWGVGGSGFVNEFPVEYEEAAKLDGAGLFTIIFRIYAPLLRPTLVAIVIIIFVVIWNDYFMSQLPVGRTGTPQNTGKC